MTLLYIGSGWDAYPLLTYNEYKTFIYVDALPKVPHYVKGMHGYKKSLTNESIIGGLLSEFSNNDEKGVKIEMIEKSDDYYMLNIGEKTLHYFFNTCDVDMKYNQRLVQLCSHVETLYCIGYKPDEVVMDLLPNIKDIHSTELCLFESKRLQDMTTIFTDYEYDDETNEYVFFNFNE